MAASAPLFEQAQALISWGEGVIERQPILGIAVFVLLAAISAMMAFFSSAVLVPLAISAWGDLVSALLLWIGWLLGGVASYCIGRFLGPRVAAMFAGDERLAVWQTTVSTRTKFVHVLLFQATVPSEIPGYVLGTLRYSFTRYLLALAITELPYVAGVVYLGDSFLRGDAWLMAVAGMAVLLLAAILFHYRDRIFKNI